MKKTYSKSALIKRRLFVLLVSILAILLIVGTIFLVTVGLKNYITFEKVDDSAKYVSDDSAKLSTPIMINNAVVGAVYNGSFVSSEKFYLNQSKKDNLDIDIDAYTTLGKKGKYKLNSYLNDSGTIYATNSVPDIGEEYIAVLSDTKNIMPNPATKVTSINENDINVVKKALGMYRVFNTTVRIDSIYQISINTEKKGRIIVATNKIGKSFGGYSTVIYEDSTGKTSVIKYSYVRNLKNASDWPLYSFKFVADLNQDGNNEIIIQETKEFLVLYDVIALNNNKFSQVLTTQIKQ